MLIKVHVTPGAKHDTVQEIKKGEFKVAVRKPPVRDLANRRSLELLAAHFGVPVDNLKIIRGRNTPSKLVHLRHLV